jgi:glutamine---fructose-6-phosphate transaminase (isomerizing)
MTSWDMLGYIREQPGSVAATLRSCQPGLAELRDAVARRQPEHVIVAGLGSSYTAAQMAAPLLRRCIPVPTVVTVATELGVDPGLRLGPGTLVVLVSRSGERGGIVDALTAARQAGAACAAVTAVESSLLAQQADLAIVTGEGPESTYAKTKSVTAAATAIMQLGLALSQDAAERALLEAALARMPGLLAEGISDAEREIGRLAGWLGESQQALITGTAGNQGVAAEAALKLQEAAAVTAEWEETGNALHGAVSILGSSWLLVALTTGADYGLNRGLLGLSGRFGARRLAVAPPGLALDDLAEALIPVPATGNRLESLVAPLLFLPPVQLLTYHLAVGRGLNPDQPLFADVMLTAMLPPGREEPDWDPNPPKEVPHP